MIRPGPVEIVLLYIILNIIVIGGIAGFVIWLVKRVARKSARDELKKYHHELHEQVKITPKAKD